MCYSLEFLFGKSHDQGYEVAGIRIGDHIGLLVMEDEVLDAVPSVWPT